MADVYKVGGRHDPKFINYLFTLKRYDCHFVVGNKELSKPETIGVVPVMLMAHSEVIQSEMFCKEIEDKKCVRVNDICPDTFRNLLRYVYGFDNTDSLSFDEADNLLYAADKYLIESLLSRLTDRLMKLLSPANICSLLNSPACYRQLELNCAITQILEFETKRVLDCPQFVELSSDALVKVFELGINAKEIEVWRAAVKWAKHQTNSDNGQDLRKALKNPAKHIRVCTFDDDSFVDEVYTTGILTVEEVGLVYLSKLKKQKQCRLITFSNELRNRSLELETLVFMNHAHVWKRTEGKLEVDTKQRAIDLLPFNFTADTEVYSGTITITKITSTEPDQVIGFCNIQSDGGFSVDVVAKNRKNIVLLPNSKYHVSVKFNKDIVMYYSGNTEPYENEHIKVIPCNTVDYPSYYIIPLNVLSYRVIKPIPILQ